MCFFFLYVVTDEQNFDDLAILKPLADYWLRLPGRKNRGCYGRAAAAPANHARPVYTAGESGAWPPCGTAAQERARKPAGVQLITPTEKLYLFHSLIL